MKAQCCICSDLFENAQTVNIAAAPCGHVFHETCLMRWMNNSSTCPSCRTHVKKTQIIKRLFFDISEDAEEDDVGSFVNQIGELKAKLREKDKSIRDLAEGRDKQAALLAVSEANTEELKTKLSQEKSMRDFLRLDIDRLKKENAIQAHEVAELRVKANRLQELQNVETVLHGCSSDVQDMLKQYSDGGVSAIHELCSLVTVVKREYNQVLLEKRAAKEKLEKLKQQYGANHKEAKQAKSKTIYLKAELDAAYELLRQKEKENDENRRKIVHLRMALKHNKTQGSQSFIEAISEDSPNVAYTPVRDTLTASTVADAKTSPEADQENNMSPPAKKSCPSPDLFEETPVKSRKGLSRKEQRGQFLPVSPSKCGESTDQSGSSDVSDKEKTTTAKVTTLNATKRNIALEKEKVNEKLFPGQAQQEADDGPLIPPAMFSIMRKTLSGQAKSCSGQESSYNRNSVITRGFDGFGGSTSFVHPSVPPRGSLMRLGQQKKKYSGSSLGVKKNSNIQRQPLLKCQPQIRDCLPSGDNNKIPAASASSLMPSMFTKKAPETSAMKKKHLSSSGMFLSKGPSLSAKPKNASSDIIDLT